MIKTLKIILTVLVTSFFFFPFEFSFLPGYNTKNIMAAIGLVLALLALIKQEEFTVPRELLLLLLFSGMVSLMSLISITYNQTPDTTYVSFIRATAIWLSSAFTTAYVIHSVHKRIDVPIVTHYLIGACLFQCIAAMLIEFIPAVHQFVDTYIEQGQFMLQKLGRLYGIGASLDVAGSRFAAVLVAISFLLVPQQRLPSKGLAIFYTLSFIIIAIVGNMIARTTTIGMVIGIIWVLSSFLINAKNQYQSFLFRNGFLVLITASILVIISIILYHSSLEVKRLMEFGFEGFFSYVETGEWQVDSNDTLKDMIVWPEQLKTWIIGDGYFLNSRYDPNYLGDAPVGGFYMSTDIGYLRFIFYFGITGLIWIIAFIVYSALICCRYFKTYSWLFILGLLVNLIVWLKVSTDIFLFFALYICALAFQESTDGLEDDQQTEIVEIP